MKKTYTILIDDREKKPLVFPHYMVMQNPSHPTMHSCKTTVTIATETTRLQTADYVLKEHPRCGVVERKGHLSEVANNIFFPPRRRLFLAELTRLEEKFASPLLMLEGSIRTMLNSNHRVGKSSKVSGGIIMDCLMRCLSKHNIPLVIIPNTSLSARQAMGEYVARFLINTAL